MTAATITYPEVLELNHLKRVSGYVFLFIAEHFYGRNQKGGRCECVLVRLFNILPGLSALWQGIDEVGRRRTMLAAIIPTLGTSFALCSQLRGWRFQILLLVQYGLLSPLLPRFVFCAARQCSRGLRCLTQCWISRWADPCYGGIISGCFFFFFLRRLCVVQVVNVISGLWQVLLLVLNKYRYVKYFLSLEMSMWGCVLFYGNRLLLLV